MLFDHRCIEYLGIRVDDQAIAEMDGARALVLLPRDTIQSIQATRGSAANRPFLLFFFGVLLVGLGLYPLRRIFTWIREGGVLFDVEVWLVVWLFIGSYAIFEAVKRRPILLITTTRGRTRMAFKGQVDLQELEAFIHKVGIDFGYVIDSGN